MEQEPMQKNEILNEYETVAPVSFLFYQTWFLFYTVLRNERRVVFSHIVV